MTMSDEESAVRLAPAQMSHEELLNHVDEMHARMTDAAQAYVDEQGISCLCLTLCATAFISPDTGEPGTPYRTACAPMPERDRYDAVIAPARQVYLLAGLEELRCQGEIMRAACTEPENGTVN
jgi:hypothetical protein